MHFDPFESLAPEVAPTEKAPANSTVAERPSKQDQERTKLVEMYSQKVPEMVLHSHTGSFAVIDGQTVREGDVLDGGVRVVAIRADEILFELLETE